MFDYYPIDRNLKKNRSKGFACDSCYKKKVKCIGPFPCQQCRMSHRECTKKREIIRKGSRSKEYNDLTMKLLMTENQLKSFDSFSAGQSSSTLSDLLDTDIRSDLIDYYVNNCLPYMNMLPVWFLGRYAAKLSSFVLKSVYLLADWTMHKSLASSSAYYEDCQAMLGKHLDHRSVFTLIGLLNLAMYASCIKNDHARTVYSGIAMRMAATMDHLDLNNNGIDSFLRDITVRLVIEIKSRVFWSCYIADIEANIALAKPELRFKGNIVCVTPSRDTIWTLNDAKIPGFDYSKSTLLGYTSDKDLRDQSPSLSPLWKKVILAKIYARLQKFLDKSHSDTLKSNEDEYILLKDSLNSWYQSLPTQLLQNLHRFSSFDIESKIDSHWAWTYNLFMYHALRIKFLTADVLQKEKQDLQLDWESARRDVLESSQFISTLCTFFLNKNPQFSFVDPLINLWIFEGGIGWIFVSQICDDYTRLLYNQGISVIFQCLDQTTPSFLLSKDLFAKLILKSSSILSKNSFPASHITSQTSCTFSSLSENTILQPSDIQMIQYQLSNQSFSTEVHNSPCIIRCEDMDELPLTF